MSTTTSDHDDDGGEFSRGLAALEHHLATTAPTPAHVPAGENDELEDGPEPDEGRA